MFRLRGLIALCLPAVLLACGGHGDSMGPADNGNPYGITATGPGVLSVSPLDTSTVFAVTPLGNLAPPGHVLPTDHVYWYFVNPWSGQQQNNDCRARPIRAAGSGVVTFVLVTEAQGDTKVNVQMTKTFHYYYDHVLLKPGIGVGSLGGTMTTAGVLRIPSTDPDPATVSMASGLVAYQGTPVQGSIAAGWLLVQMLTDERIRVEYFSGATTRPTAFTGAAHEYVR